MKKILLLFGSLLLLAQASRAQTFPVDTLIKNGPLQNRINLVFVGDGYQASEMGKYISDVNRAVSAIFQQEPFRQYQRYFNVFAIRVPSAQSGTTHPRTAADCNLLPVSAPNTYFNTTFDYNNTHRAIVTTGQIALASVLVNSFPRYTRAIVIANTPEYGGTGGASITMTANTTAPETMIHEMGHTFAGLADEYWVGATVNERANRTQPAVNPPLRWQSWVGTNGVGDYRYSEDPTWSRPHQNCKMQYLNAPFCSVCIEGIVESIHTAARRTVEDFSPVNQIITNPTQAIPFSLTLLGPNPNTLRVTWTRDGTRIAGNVTQLTVPLTQLTGGPHTIRAEVTDTTTFVRKVNHQNFHRYIVEWDVTNTVTGTSLAATLKEYAVETFPNPVTDVLNLKYTLSQPGDVKMTILDAAGRRVKTLTRARQAAGSYTYQLQADELNLRQAGVYTLLLEIDGMVMSRQVLKQ